MTAGPAGQSVVAGPPMRVLESCSMPWVGHPDWAVATAVEAVGIPARPKVAFVDGEHLRLFPEAIVRVSYVEPRTFGCDWKETLDSGGEGGIRTLGRGISPYNG